MPQTSCLRPSTPTLRRIDVADVGETVLADTVGLSATCRMTVAAFKPPCRRRVRRPCCCT